MTQTARMEIARQIAQEAGAVAMDYFQRRDALVVDKKQHQDFVSEADREVELLIRARLAEALPEDAIVGEEHAPKAGSSGFTWVLDPIDGTTNFLSGVPFWCVAIAGVSDAGTQVGVIHDPNHAETFSALRGAGAWLNDKPLRLGQSDITTGTVCIGSSRRSPTAQVAALIQGILEAGGVFARTGSGALGLAYVAAGRYLGYTESYMNSWDCLAGLLMIDEAGGQSLSRDDKAFVTKGGPVTAAAPGVYDPLWAITQSAFSA